MSLSLATWEFIEYSGEAVVIIGVIGEFVAEFTSFAKDEHQKKKLTRFSGLILIFGLAVELAGLVKTSQLSALEIARLKKEAGQANQKVEELRKENTLLEARIQPRRITPEQKAILLKELSGLTNKCRVVLLAQMYDTEAQVYMLQIRDALRDCGFDAEGGPVLIGDTGPPRFGVSVIIHDQTNFPPCANGIVHAFVTAGLIRTNVVDLEPRPHQTNLVRVSVDAKPLE